MTIEVSKKFAPTTFTELIVYSFGMRLFSNSIKAGSTEPGLVVSCAHAENVLRVIKKNSVKILEKKCGIKSMFSQSSVKQ